ncbi:V-type proton ATPase subunit c1 [Hibiscus syriacus]|uniref:V-type proton ATPase proteolipid subunit n=1 Tax=Hibiscus syriacus TaxID=106335 RepID=A0A6A2ZL50_HIBSY|nr:V-type proton ATPase subunit c1 [Hibiscus syriacus]
MGATYGTAKSGVGVASMGVMRPELVMKSIVPVVMAGVLGIYGLIIAVIISTGINPKAKSYYLFDGYAHLSSGLACGLAGLSAGKHFQFSLSNNHPFNSDLFAVRPPIDESKPPSFENIVGNNSISVGFASIHDDPVIRLRHLPHHRVPCIISSPPVFSVSPSSPARGGVRPSKFSTFWNRALHRSKL